LPVRSVLLFAGLVLSLPSPVSASAVQDTVLFCNQGSPCTILDQSTAGAASATTALFGGIATGFADATGGILHALSSYTFPAAAPVPGQVNGNAQFFDQVTINAPGLAGTMGFLILAFAVTGSTSPQPNPPANAVVAVFTDAGISLQTGNTSNCPGTTHCQSQTVTGNSEVVFLPMPFTFGQSFSLEADLDAVTFYSPGGGLSALSDFQHTAALNGMGVFEDSNGTMPAPNPSFVSADGVNYSVNGIVPEPGSFLSVGCAVGVWIVLRLRRGRA